MHTRSSRYLSRSDRLVVRGGLVVDPGQGIEHRLDLIIEACRVAALCTPGSPASRPKRGDRVLDAQRMLVLPGLIDLHVHLREPGMTEAEDVGSGSRAAAAGGFTTVVCMPNTKPPLDNPRVLAGLVASISRNAIVRVLPAAALSGGLLGRQATAAVALAEAGAWALSDDGTGTARPHVLAAALRHAEPLCFPVLVHCEDHLLSGNGVMRLGRVARTLALPGIPPEAESGCLQRHLAILAETGGRLHVQHVSTRSSLELIRRAKARGLPVSCEVTPHHLFLTENEVAQSSRTGAPDPNLKMNPPLGSARDRQALRMGLRDGTVDAVATDHAPHTGIAKSRGFLLAPFGVVGLETAFPLMLRLVEEGVVPLARAIWLLTRGPAGVLGIAAGSLRPGALADLTVVDPHAEWQVTPGVLHSKSKNSAFLGWTMRGRTRWTLVAGQVVFGPALARA